MTEESAEQIAPEFAQWYGQLEIGRDETRRQARWEGVVNVVDEPDPELIEALVRLAFGSRHSPRQSAMDKIVAGFRDADATFTVELREIELLATAALSELIKRGGDIGALAALATMTARFAAQRKPGVPVPLVELAKDALAQGANTAREPPSLTDLDVPLKLELANLDNLPQTFDGNATKAHFEAVKSGFNKLGHRQAQLISHLKVQDEELQMLWWLISAFSPSCNCAFESVPADAQALIFPSDLASFTQILPGPVGITGLLSKAGLNGKKKLLVANAINAAEGPWADALVSPNDVSPVTLPLHLALKRRKDTGGGDKWVAGWAATVDVAESLTLSPLALGEQFYRERLLLLRGGW